MGDCTRRAPTNPWQFPLPAPLTKLSSYPLCLFTDLRTGRSRANGQDNPAIFGWTTNG